MNPKANAQRKSLNAKDFQRPTHGPKTDQFIGMTGAQAFHEMMRQHGVECIFGYPGGRFSRSLMRFITHHTFNLS